MKEYNKIMLTTLETYIKTLKDDVNHNRGDIKFALRDIAYLIKNWLNSLEEEE